MEFPTVVEGAMLMFDAKLTALDDVKVDEVYETVIDEPDAPL